MLQMVRTLAQFSIALEEMNEIGENTGDEGGGGGGGGGGGRDGDGEEAVARDAVDQFRNNNRNIGGNLNGLPAGSPIGEVVWFLLVFQVVSAWLVLFRKYVPLLYLRCFTSKSICMFFH